MVEALQVQETTSGRASQGELRRQVHAVLRRTEVLQLLECIPDVTAVLNLQRQIVWGNGALLRACGTTRDAVIGLRPGEAIRCVNADLGPDGCGSSPQCPRCPAVQAIYLSHAGRDVARRAGAMTFADADSTCHGVEAHASPFFLREFNFTVLILQVRRVG